MNIAIIPGSFDPVTNGHLDIIKRTSDLFDLVYVCILSNSSKNPLFSIDERIDMINRVTKDMGNVKVESFTGLLVDCARKNNAKFIVKGLRALSDFDYEFQMALTNKRLAPEIETFFLTTNSNYSYLSSSLVKEIAHYNGDISDMVPKEIINDIKTKIGGKI